MQPVQRSWGRTLPAPWRSGKEAPVAGAEGVTPKKGGGEGKGQVLQGLVGGLREYLGFYPEGGGSPRGLRVWRADLTQVQVRWDVPDYGQLCVLPTCKAGEGLSECLLAVGLFPLGAGVGPPQARRRCADLPLSHRSLRRPPPGLTLTSSTHPGVVGAPC